MERRDARRFKPSLRMCLFAFLGVGLSCLPLQAQEPQQTQETRQSASADAPKQTATIAGERDVSWRTLPQNFLQDQKEIWLFPTQLAKGRHWLPTLGVVGATAIL